ncbi:MAG TPA: hypothetical protein VJP86_08330, partial [Vicinamibacterales bacterium]|nr:hypothetical protein [Vicinamibacterales bacterium]
RHLRSTNLYPIGEEESQGPRRRSPIIGQRLKMQPAGHDIKKYAFNLGFLGSYLSSMQDHGNVIDRIPQMIHALECERLRLRKLDSSIGLIDVPGPPTREKECASD